MWKNIRIDGPALGDRPGDCVEDLGYYCRIGESYGIGVLLENRSNTVISTDIEAASIFREINGASSGLVFNPLEYARARRHPFLNEFYKSKLKGLIRFFRVNDGLFEDGSPALPGMGNAEIKEISSILLCRGFKGYFSFAPYFENTDLDTFKRIISSFRMLLLML